MGSFFEVHAQRPTSAITQTIWVHPCTRFDKALLNNINQCTLPAPFAYMPHLGQPARFPSIQPVENQMTRYRPSSRNRFSHQIDRSGLTKNLSEEGMVLAPLGTCHINLDKVRQGKLQKLLHPSPVPVSPALSSVHSPNAASKAQTSLR